MRVGNRFGLGVLWIANELINTALIVVILILLGFGIYAIWDINTVVKQALPLQYEVYKPAKDDVSFQDLKLINPDVFGWLTIYGTNIDYPVVQGEDNAEYLTKSAEGKYSLSGAIFLDYHNNKSFTDFNSIIYGHHMDMNAMFGDVGDFKDEAVFQSYRYGNLYFDGKNHGIEIFAFLEVDAYNTGLFSPGVTNVEARQRYLDEISTAALHMRELGISTDDRIVILSTCTEAITNGRHLLIGRIVDTVYEDAFAEEVQEKKREYVDELQEMRVRDLAPLIMLMIMIVLLTMLLAVLRYQYKANHRNGKMVRKDERQGREK